MAAIIYECSSGSLSVFDVAGFNHKLSRMVRNSYFSSVGDGPMFAKTNMTRTMTLAIWLYMLNGHLISLAKTASAACYPP